jgi:hypothetical protein
MTWLLRKRTGEDLKTNGWDFLVGKDKIEAEIVPGANHFSLTQKPAVTKMGAFLNRALIVLELVLERGVVLERVMILSVFRFFFLCSNLAR